MMVGGIPNGWVAKAAGFIPIRILDFVMLSQAFTTFCVGQWILHVCQPNRRSNVVWTQRMRGERRILSVGGRFRRPLSVYSLRRHLD